MPGSRIELLKFDIMKVCCVPWVHFLKIVQIFFWVMFATTFGTRKLHEARNSWHSGCWILKSLVYAMSIGIPFIIPNIFIQLYGKFNPVLWQM